MSSRQMGPVPVSEVPLTKESTAEFDTKVADADRVDGLGPHSQQRVRSSRRVVSWWIFKRLAIGLVVLWVVSLVVFAATQALPSDPAQAILGRDATPERVAALRSQLNLNDGIVAQYTSWLGGVVHGDFGDSLARRQPVNDLLWSRFNNSFLLFGAAAVVAVPLSILLGTISAARRDRASDRFGVTVALLLSAVPEFVLGVLLTLLLATGLLHLFPAVAILPAGQSALDRPEVLVLPVLTLVFAVVPYLYRLVRASMIDTLESEYVQMAHLKGISPRSIVRRHALPNALVPMIQASALVMAYLFSGVLVVEFLFRYPGLGTMLSEAVAARDLPVIQAVTMLFAVVIILLNLMADLLTVLVSPRVRSGGLT